MEIDAGRFCALMENFTNPVRIKILQLLVEKGRQSREAIAEQIKESPESIDHELSMLLRRSFVEEGLGEYEVTGKVQDVAVEIQQGCHALRKDVVAAIAASQR